MISETDARAAWTHALRNPGAPPRTFDCGGGIVAGISIDETPEGRFARVTVRRESDPPLPHEESVPIASQLFVLGRFEPFPVDSVRGADGRTWHHTIDFERYKEHRAEELRRQAGKLVAGLAGDDLEVAAIQLGLPIEQLLSSCDPRKAAARDERTLKFLSDKFQIPERWVLTQLSLYEAGELADG